MPEPFKLDDDETTPRKRPSADDEDRPRENLRKRREDDEEDDRPRRRASRRRDEEDDRPPRPIVSRAQAEQINKIIWGMTAGWVVLVTMNYMGTKTDGAIQQAALAAQTCAALLIPYVFARATDRFTRD